MPAAGGLTSMHNGVTRGRIAAWGLEPHAATSTHGSSATICPSTTDALSLSALRSKVTDLRDSYLPRPGDHRKSGRAARTGIQDSVWCPRM